jgi:hypothetical protein
MVDGSIDLWINTLLKAKQNAAHLAQGDTDIARYQRDADYSFAQIVRDILNLTI